MQNKSKRTILIGNLISLCLIAAVSFILLYYLGITGISAVGITTALATLGAVFNRKMLGGIFVLSGIAFAIKSLTDMVSKKLSSNKENDDRRADA